MLYLKVHNDFATFSKCIIFSAKNFKFSNKINLCNKCKKCKGDFLMKKGNQNQDQEKKVIIRKHDFEFYISI